MAPVRDVMSRRYKRFLAIVSFPVLVYMVFYQNIPAVQFMSQIKEIEMVNRDGVLVPYLLNSDLIQKFIDEIEKENVTVFLIEPRILNVIIHLTNEMTIETNNLQINSDINDTHFVSFGVTTDIDSDFQKIKFYGLKQNGFENFKVKGVTSRPEFHQNNLSHIFLYHQLRPLLLHLVVFYNRGDNFIWNDRIHLVNPPDWLKTDQLSFGHNASGFNNLELTQTRLGDLTLLAPSNISRFLLQDIPESRFIECNETRVKEFYRANPGFEATETGRNRAMRASKLLKSLKSTMDEVGVKYWLSSGTLLGWFRQCGFISYTSDMDFEVYIKDYTPDILTTFKSHGFRQRRQLGRLNDSFEMTFNKQGLTMDVFYVYEEPDHIWVGGVGLRGEKYRFTFPIITLCWGELLGVAVRVPCDTPNYLVTVYGTNWTAPVTRWRWSESPRNIKKVGQWTREEMKETMKYMG
ncbi:hypothetical protein LOTGIDRAFT_233814 [Lottia gigantea]|uniref:Fukutin n=1 Tax=Lottia gigantea TaxID=225164 RepID=V3ZGD7_LOTGI|nr:hypothetical protein LOTGIDRAFT_233814 [Lottia gigantea]ESO90288.1 hypothetical protein LOTGIDRAFT_233814 [Lottia gigantea]